MTAETGNMGFKNPIIPCVIKSLSLLFQWGDFSCTCIDLSWCVLKSLTHFSSLSTSQSVASDMSLYQSWDWSSSVLSLLYVLVFLCMQTCTHCMWRFMRAYMTVCVCASIHTAHTSGHVGLGAGNYCSVVKHHYSLICPLAPSVLLSTTSYTISTTPRTTPPTCTPSISWSTGL